MGFLDKVPGFEDERAGLVRLSDVQPERVSWQWPGRLPLGKLVVLDGDPAVGKSTVSAFMAATVTTGRPWPDGSSCPPGDVLILSAEDGLADTIRPRLDAAGADVARVHALTAVHYADEDGNPRSRPPTLADVGVIERAIRAHGARLVIVDVLMAFLPGKVDSHRDQDIRGVLSTLSALTERTGCVMVLLRHLNKAPGGSPLYRGGGSIGIIGAARAALLAAVDPDDESRRVLAVTKSNLAAMPPALAYRLVDDPERGCARVQWEGATHHSAYDLLGARESDEERTERDEVAAWLADFLTDRGGEATAVDVYKAGNAEGHSRDALKRAKKRAGVESVKTGMTGGWVWKLAGREHEAREESGFSDGAPFTPFARPSGKCQVCHEPLDPKLAEHGDVTHPVCAA